MADFEKRFIDTYEPRPLLWKHYIDDVICLWTHGEEKLHEFTDYLNSHLPRIKFTMKFSKKSVEFLDTLLKCEDEVNLSTDLFCKENGSHNYLLFSSSHPETVKLGLPYSEFL